MPDVKMSTTKQPEPEPEERDNLPPVASEIAEDIGTMQATDEPAKASSSPGSPESVTSPPAGDETSEDSF